MPGGRGKRKRNQGLRDTSNNQDVDEAVTDEPDDEEDEKPALKELVPRETVIGRNNYKVTLSNGEVIHQEFEITYGNLLLPIIPEKGPVAIKREKYDAYLNEFLDSPEGQEYRRPSQFEIDAACANIKAQIEQYNAEKRGVKGIDYQNQAQQTQTPVQPQPAPQVTPQAAPQQQQQQTSYQTGAADAQLAAQLEAAQRQLTAQEQLLAQSNAKAQEQQLAFAQQQAQIEDLRTTVTKLTAERDAAKNKLDSMKVSGEYDEEENSNPASGRDMVVLKALCAISALFTLLIAGLLGYFLFTGGIPTAQEPASEPTAEIPPSFEGEGTLNINGEEYSVPLSTIQIENGQTKTVFYAVQTSLSDSGDVTADAYPIGTWVFESDKVSMEKEEPETTENK